MVLPNPDTISAECSFRVSKRGDRIHEFVDRWSQSHVALPAASAVPACESDVVALISYAKEHDLKIVVAGGAHGAFVPITSETLYVDLRRLDSIEVNPSLETVTVGGGVLTGDLWNALASQGFYTCLPNSNGVGVVGAFLGGGGGPFNAVKGFFIDHAISVRILVATGQTLVLNSRSNGDEEALWHAIRGGGHGLGVVTSLTVRVFRLANLSLDDEKVWVRRIIFPATAIGIAASAYRKLHPLRGPISAVLIIARSPPGTSNAGAPVIVLAVSYFGPGSEAEKILAPLFDSEILKGSLLHTTLHTNIRDLNDSTKAFDPHGGFKALESTFISSIDSSTIKSLFDNFIDLGNELPDSRQTSVVIAGWDPTVSIQNGNSKQGRQAFFEPRDRGYCVYQFAWWTKQDSLARMDSYLHLQMTTARDKEPGPVRRFANNLKYPSDLSETYSPEKIAQLRKVKSVWDHTGLFWNP
jgi:hypothetical protein